MAQHFFDVSRVDGIAAHQTVESQPKSPQPWSLGSNLALFTPNLPSNNVGIVIAQTHLVSGETLLCQGRVD
eukprot:9466860-Pyramimonas_sp.AAC.1